MEVKRDAYLNKLIRKMRNGLVKVVTGARQCGKSYLLTHLFHDHLRSIGVPEDHIIEIALDDGASKALRDPDVILHHIRGLIKDAGDYFVVIDEVQRLSEFEDVLNSLLHIRNADVYVTGGSAKFLSTDVITQFRGRGDEIHVYPLSFSEFLSGYSGTQDEAWDDYLVYGGMPLVLTMTESEDKVDYLSSLFRKVYLPNIVKRHRVRNKAALDELVDGLASAVGSCTNPTKLVRTFKSSQGATFSDKTIKNYIDYLIDSFLISNAVCYDIKGKKHIDSASKYYFEDIGLRNACLGFRQIEPTHLMENIIYNELRVRGCRVDVVECSGAGEDGKRTNQQLEVDFVATKGSEKYYVQSAFALPTAEKIHQEQRGLLSIPDSFRKIVVVGDNIKVRRDENGITTIGLRNFLLDKDSLRL